MPSVIGVASECSAARAMTWVSSTFLRPSTFGDVLELGHGLILILRVGDLVEAGPSSPLAALVKVLPATMLVS
jgi:hypothetical protein